MPLISLRTQLSQISRPKTLFVKVSKFNLSSFERLNSIIYLLCATSVKFYMTFSEFVFNYSCQPHYIKFIYFVQIVVKMKIYASKIKMNSSNKLKKCIDLLHVISSFLVSIFYPLQFLIFYYGNYRAWSMLQTNNSNI